MENVTIEDQFEEEQFALQLLFEDLTADQIRDRARYTRQQAAAAGMPHDSCRVFALRVYFALHRSQALTYKEADAQFDAWCDGSGVTRGEIGEELRNIIVNPPKTPAKGNGHPA